MYEHCMENSPNGIKRKVNTFSFTFVYNLMYNKQIWTITHNKLCLFQIINYERDRERERFNVGR